MDREWKQGDNPADKSGVLIHRPRPIASAIYERSIHRVTDQDTGDYLVVSLGHAGGIGQWTFGNLKTGMAAYGGYRSWGGGPSGVTVFETPSLRTKLSAKARHLNRSEYDLTRIAEMFRALKDAAAPGHQNEVLVVDSRPE